MLFAAQCIALLYCYYRHILFIFVDVGKYNMVGCAVKRRECEGMSQCMVMLSPCFLLSGEQVWVCPCHYDAFLDYLWGTEC